MLELKFKEEDVQKFFLKYRNGTEEDKFDFGTIIAHELFSAFAPVCGNLSNIIRHSEMSTESLSYAQELFDKASVIQHTTKQIQDIVIDESANAEDLVKSSSDFYNCLVKFIGFFPFEQRLGHIVWSPRFAEIIKEHDHDPVKDVDYFAGLHIFKLNRLFSSGKQEECYLNDDLRFHNPVLFDILRNVYNSRGIILTPHQQTIPEIITSVDYLSDAVIPLITNAVDHAFNPENDISHKFESNYKKKIDIKGSEDKGGYFEISIEDNGTGISSENADKIFQRGFSTKPEDESGVHGTGLWAVKRFVEENGGKIGFETEFGKGTKFTFTIPYARKDGFVYIQEKPR